LREQRIGRRFAPHEHHTRPAPEALIHQHAHMLARFQRAREAQRRAFPTVSPIVLELEAEEAWQMVLKAVAARKWLVVDQVKPGGRIGVGHIDAIDATLLMGFPQDVTIRLRPLAGQTRIDIRSASRFGRHDFGVNAQRIQRFAQELQAQLDAR
jgi:uncharacterized protein (DUF1499 family)